MIKGYIDNNNNTLFLCPNCGFQKIFNALPFKDKKKITIKCQCGISTKMDIEFREHFRKKVEIPGVCIVEKSKKRCDIIIDDISVGGVRIKFVFINKKYIAEIEVGDTIFIEFQLDTAKEKVITKKCIVKIKLNTMIGAAFSDDNYSREIGFYMMQ